MSGFTYRFRLERVRALRERREELAKLELAGALRRRQRCDQELTGARARIADAYAAQLQAAGADLRIHQAYLEHLERVQSRLAGELSGHEREVAGRRATLTVMAQERAALEKLKERGLDAHKRELARVEQLVLDEISGNRYWRQAA